jgi:transposase
MIAGVDLHKSSTNIAVMDDEGHVIKEVKIKSNPDELMNFSESLPANSDIVIESSSTWYWAYRILSERHHVVLSNPLKTKAIASAKAKTDKIDALTLANLLRGGYIAECYIPSNELMQLRELVRYRAELVRMRTNLKNNIHAILLMYNVKVEGYPFTQEYINKLKQLNDYRINGYLEVIEALNREINSVEEMIKKQAEEDQNAKLLMTIPGISYYSALLIASEIGDISRFPDSSHLVSYAGLAPSTRSSAGKTHYGPITKQGSKYLRWILNQVTWANIRNEPEGTVAKFYQKLKAKKGSQKAITAASAKMLKIIYWVLKEKRPYHS